MQKSLITILVAVLMAPTLSFAEKGDIVVRARVTHIAPDESSHLDTSIGDKLEVNSNTIPEIDFSYYFTKNIAAELILAVGSRHDVNIGGKTRHNVTFTQTCAHMKAGAFVVYVTAKTPCFLNAQPSPGSQMSF